MIGLQANIWLNAIANWQAHDISVGNLEYLDGNNLMLTLGGGFLKLL